MLTTRISALLLCGALAACCLTGCGGKTAAPTAAPSGSAAVSSAGDGVYVPTEEGIYELQSISPGSANLFYTDAATKSRIFLCADPGCSHDSDRCTSYIATPGASFLPLLLRAGDGLLVFFAGTDEEAPRAMTGVLCFLAGLVSFFVCKVWNARMTRKRVLRGSITSSM